MRADVSGLPSKRHMAESARTLACFVRWKARPSFSYASCVSLQHTRAPLHVSIDLCQTHKHAQPKGRAAHEHHPNNTLRQAASRRISAPEHVQQFAGDHGPQCLIVALRKQFVQDPDPAYSGSHVRRRLAGLVRQAGCAIGTRVIGAHASLALSKNSSGSNDVSTPRLIMRRPGCACRQQDSTSSGSCQALCTPDARAIRQAHATQQQMSPAPDAVAPAIQRRSLLPV